MRPERYFVRSSKNISQDLSETVFKVFNNFEGLNNTYGVLAYPQEIDAVKKIDSVICVEKDFIIQSQSVNFRNVDPQRGNWGLDRIDQRSLPLSGNYAFTYSGIGVDCYVIDTGIFSQHREFGSRVKKLFDAYRNSTDPRYTEDDNGHGTHVAGIIGGSTYGVANQISLYSLKVFSSSGTTNLGNLLASFSSCITHHQSKGGPGSPGFKPSVANMSFTGNFSEIMNAGVQDMIDAGITCVIAAGNFGQPAGEYSPASVVDGITVAASDRSDRFSIFSNASTNVVLSNTGPNNYGSVVDIIAPGSDIRSAYIGANDSFRNLSGTSMAAPHVSGVVAQLLEQNKLLTTTEVKNRLLSDATKGAIELNTQAKDSMTPNLFLFTSPSDTIINWITPAGQLAAIPENTLVNLRVEANSFDINNNSLPIEYRLVSGSLPQGLALRNNGRIEGTTPDITGNQDYSFTIEADNTLTTSTRSFSIRVIGENRPPQWDPRTPSNLEISYGVFDVGSEILIDFLNFIDPVDNSQSFPAAFDPDGDTISFTLSGGELPDFAQLNRDGVIVGVVDSFPFETLDPQITVKRYTFTVRISDGEFFRDQTFTLVIRRDPQNSDHNSSPIWTTPDFMEGPLAEYVSTEVVGLTLNAVDPENDRIMYYLDNTNFPNINTPNLDETTFYGLPPGLELSDNGRITGRLDCVPKAGDYFFQVSVTDGFNISSRTFFIRILEVVDGNSIVISPAIDKIVWNTPSGLLGTLIETYSSPFTISAKSNLNSQIMYSLAPLSNPLPPGLSLDNRRGQIRGQLQYVDRPREYTFIIRAYNVNKPWIFNDREFSINVKDRFFEPVMDISFLITGDEKFQFLDWHLNPENLPDNFIFRPSDPNYGRNVFPKMYILGGFPEAGMPQKLFDAIKPEDDTIPFTTTHQELCVFLGDIKSKSVTDENNNILYDVIYYEVLDPNGFVGGPEPILYDQVGDINTKNLRLIYPSSVNNWRQDLTNKLLSFNEERMPRWMDDEYKMAVEIAYIQPGQGPAAINYIKSQGVETHFGNKGYIIDRYLVTDFTVVYDQTEFDIGTGFDDCNTLLDVKEHKGTERFYKFPPGDIFG